MIITTQIDTAAGLLTAASTEEGICLLSFSNVQTPCGGIDFLKRYFNTGTVTGTSEYLELLRYQLAEYFDGTRQEFSVPLITAGTAFQQSVWNELLNIKYGTTRSYAAQAAAIGKQKSVRAVGAANGANRIAILIPCHRVTGSDGSLTGYAGGLEKKRFLLNHEMKFSKTNFNLTLFDTTINKSIK